MWVKIIFCFRPNRSSSLLADIYLASVKSHSIDDGSSLSRKEGVEYTNFSTGDLDDLSIKAVN